MVLQVWGGCTARGDDWQSESSWSSFPCWQIGSQGNKQLQMADTSAQHARSWTAFVKRCERQENRCKWEYHHKKPYFCCLGVVSIQKKKKKAQLELKKTTAERQLKTSMHLKQCLRHWVIAMLYKAHKQPHRNLPLKLCSSCCRPVWRHSNPAGGCTSARSQHSGIRWQSK